MFPVRARPRAHVSTPRRARLRPRYPLPLRSPFGENRGAVLGGRKYCHPLLNCGRFLGFWSPYRRVRGWCLFEVSEACFAECARSALRALPRAAR